jgi:cystathionine beta-synthase
MQNNAGIYESVEDLIGNTPLVKIKKCLLEVPVGEWLKKNHPSVKSGRLSSELLAKVEFLNPGGSVKDRIARKIVFEAAKRGQLKPGGTIIEATSGNTGAGLAVMAAIHGYKAIFAMPDKMSSEKINALRAYGAKVVVCPSKVEPDHPEYYCNVAKRLSQEIPGSLLANQYFNSDNPQAHIETTGPEIWAQTSGHVDAFVAGIGTGGTFSGTGEFLKKMNPKIDLVAIDPKGSIYSDLITTGKFDKAQPYLVEGVGEDMVPGTMNLKLPNHVITVNDEESFSATRMLAEQEGLLVGGSCGLALYGALQYLLWQESQGRKNLRVVVLLPDSGSRYLSKVFNDQWLRGNQVKTEWQGRALGGLLEYTPAANKVEGV